MVLCYDLSFRSDINNILFSFFLLPFVFYENICVCDVRDDKNTMIKNFDEIIRHLMLC